MNQPFSFYHQIFFKKSSAAWNLFGESVYGRLLKPPKSKEKFKAVENEFRFQIDAPKINGRNTLLSTESKVALFYKGVLFSDIDLNLSYPEIS